PGNYRSRCSWLNPEFGKTAKAPSDLPVRHRQRRHRPRPRIRPAAMVTAAKREDDFGSAQILLVRSAKWSWLKAWAMKIARHRGMKKAIVALARRLAVIMHRIWVDGTEFRWTREGAATA